MNVIKLPTSKLNIFLLLIFLLFSLGNLFAQDYVLLNEGFENVDSTTWTLKNARISNMQSYKGQNSLEITGLEYKAYRTDSNSKGQLAVEILSSGECSMTMDLPDDVDEIVVRGWMKLFGATWRNKNFATLSIQSDNNAIKDNEIGSLGKDAQWTGFEKEIKIPKGAKKIKIICKNAVAKSFAYFDEISIEKRQIGFVKRESSWAKSLKQINQKANLLVRNGDFEDGAVVWDSYWGFSLSKTAHSGDYSCMIQNNDSGKWKGSSNLELFKIPQGTKRLKVSVWIKADNVVGGANAWETGAILLSFTDEFGNEISNTEPIARTVGTHDWKKFETYFSVPERATNFKILLQLAASTGKIYFDDIVAKPVSDEEYYQTNIILKNPGFENLLSGWTSSGGEATQEAAHSGKYSLKMAGTKPAYEMKTQTLTVMKDKKDFTFSIWVKTVGITETPNDWEGAIVFIEFKDINGISLKIENIGRAVGTKDWTQLSKKIGIPEDAVEFTISCGRSNVAGKAYFDDAKLEY